MSINLNPLVKSAIENAIIRALKARPMTLHSEGGTYEVFEIQGELYDYNEAVEKILGVYSWW